MPKGAIIAIALGAAAWFLASRREPIELAADEDIDIAPPERRAPVVRAPRSAPAPAPAPESEFTLAGVLAQAGRDFVQAGATLGTAFATGGNVILTRGAG